MSISAHAPWRCSHGFSYYSSKSIIDWEKKKKTRESTGESKQKTDLKTKTRGFEISHPSFCLLPTAKYKKQKQASNTEQ